MQQLFVKPGAEGLLSPLQPWLTDPDVAEIMINAPGEVFVERRGKITQHQLTMLTPLYLQRLFQFIANEAQQRLDETNPMLAGNLFDGSRVQLVIPPISSHHTLTIRRQSIRALTLTDYSAKNFYQHLQAVTQLNNTEAFTGDYEQELLTLYQQKQWDPFIKLAIACRKTIVISGGTSSGKTTFLNACLQEIDHSERLILLEDTRELVAPHANMVSLLAANSEQSKAKVNMQQLVQCSLRLRPDRLIMGEIRGREIMDFISACATGHEGSFTSIHANNPYIAMLRMVQMYKQNNVPSMRDEEIRTELNSVIDIILQLNKTKNGRIAKYCYYKAAVY